MITQTNRRNRHPVLTLWIFTVLLLGCSSKNKEKNTIRLDDIKLSTLSGEKIDMEEFKGKTVFINFWATWCKPCIQEMPTINSAQSMFNDNDVVFLFASNEEIDRINAFSTKHPYIR